MIVIPPNKSILPVLTCRISGRKLASVKLV